MTKLMIPVAASLLLAAAPAWSDTDSETRTEERVEQNTGVLGTERTRTVETERESDDDPRSVRREETTRTDGGSVDKRVEERVDHVGDDD
jgi:hypothetical protein